MKRRAEGLYTVLAVSGARRRGGREALYICRQKGRTKRVILRERLGVPFGVSRPGPASCRTADGTCEASALLVLDRGPVRRTGLTRPSTRGWTPSPWGLCPHSPSGHGPPLPVLGPRGRPIPASAGNGCRTGPCAVGSPSGLPSWDASVRRRRPGSPSGDLSRHRLAVQLGRTDPSTRPGMATWNRVPTSVGPRDQVIWPRCPTPLRRETSSGPGRSVAAQGPTSVVPEAASGHAVVADGPASAGPDTASAPSVRPPPCRSRPVWPTAIVGRRPSAPCRRPAPPGATSVALDAGR